MTVELLTEHNLDFLSLKGDCTGSSESTLVKVSHCWKSHAVAQIEAVHSPSKIYLKLFLYCTENPKSPKIKLQTMVAMELCLVFNP